MAVVAPFRALRYNLDKIAGMEQVVTPPYDVINASQQDGFYNADPHNIIRLELNRKRDSDSAADNRYTRAAEHLQRWMQSGVLKRDEKPAFYVSRTTYQDPDGNERVRTGFFTLLRLEDFDAGVVLPHERTFTEHKEDRLALIKKTRANISPIFALYPDDQNAVMGALQNAQAPAPDYDFIDPMGLRQQLHAVSDPAACASVRKLMADKVIFIADGHHRYETALNYRNHMRGQCPEAGLPASFNYVMVYLCSMSDPGLTVFACHRAVPRLDGFSAVDFMRHARQDFDEQVIEAPGGLAANAPVLVEALAQAGRQRPSIGMACHDSDKLHILSLKPGAMDAEEGPDVFGPLRQLDVAVLTRMILEKILGLDNNARDMAHLISYNSDTRDTLAQVQSGQARVAFLLNPTKVEQVKAVAEAGLIMPRKSTYFYPKALTGLTLNLVLPDEDIAAS